MATRFHQAVLIASALVLSWLMMQAVHELGHVVAAYASAARVERVVLDPLAISRTDVSGQRAPLIVVWAGPIVGVALPLAAWLAVSRVRPSIAYLARFFAGFCLVANGAYLGVGSFDGVGDAGDLLRHGAPQWTLWLFGAIAVPGGLALWHKLGPHFGLGAARGHVDVRHACICLITSAALVSIEFALAAR